MAAIAHTKAAALQAVSPRIAAGSTGPRGVVDIIVASSGTSWSDSEALAGLLAAGYGAPLENDVVTLENLTAGTSITKAYTGSAWSLKTTLFAGNVRTAGSIWAAGQFSTGGYTGAVIGDGGFSAASGGGVIGLGHVGVWGGSGAAGGYGVLCAGLYGAKALYVGGEMVITSNARVVNLNADLLDGLEAVDFTRADPGHSYRLNGGGVTSGSAVPNLASTKPGVDRDVEWLQLLIDGNVYWLPVFAN